MKVRTRIAPSPTGIPHTGTIRTALFSYLLAKKYQGEFILRIEDTDQKRYIEGSIEAIYEIFDFLNIPFDESPKIGGAYGPYIQTQRKDIYQKYAKELVKKGVAYESEGAIRIKMPDDGYSVWNDLIQGKISYPNIEIDDKVLLKSDGLPTYHLAVVVDDHLMNISHVVRGVEWISSTPVHLLLYQALGWETPIIAHVPIVLGPDKSKLSKRHGAKSVLEYRSEGYLKEAIINFLFYLGYSYQDNSKLLTLEQMIEVFDEKKLQKQNAIFDIQKLNYFNKQWIKSLDNQDLGKRLSAFLSESWVKNDMFKEIVPLIKERLTTLKDASSLIKFFFEEPEIQTVNLEFINLASLVLETASWDKQSIEAALTDSVDQKGYDRRQFFMDLRLAITGQNITPPLTESMLVLGKEKVLQRLKTYN